MTPITARRSRVDGLTGRRYCRLCGPEPVPADAADATTDAEVAASPEPGEGP